MTKREATIRLNLTKILDQLAEGEHQVLEVSTSADGNWLELRVSANGFRASQIGEVRTDYYISYAFGRYV